MTHAHAHAHAQSSLHALSFLAAVGLALTLFPNSARGSSILLTPPFGWNGFAISANIEAGFRESLGGGVIATKNQTFMLVRPDPEAVPGLVFASTPISVTQAPASGEAKDVASGALNFSYTVGPAGASANDHFDFSLTSTTSAMNAMVDFGGGLVHADAFFHASLTLRTMGPINDAVGAFFGLPDMPSLSSPTESMTAIVTKGLWSAPGTLATLHPGDTGSEVSLTMSRWDQEFVYTFTYDIVTPYGTDPTYSYDLSGAAGVAAAPAVPEPSTALFLCLGAALAFWRKRDGN